MPVKNKTLARKIIKHILAEPLRLNMVSWKVRKGYIEGTFSAEFDVGREYKLPSCGTAACIGGWAEILGDSESWAPVDSLGLSPKEAQELCCGGWYKSPEYSDATVEQRAQMAADKITEIMEL